MRRFSTRQQHLGTLSELNVTPLLDLAFVLLVIFMITTPLLRQGVQLDLPETKSSQPALTPETTITLAVDRHRQLSLNGVAINKAELAAKLADELRSKPEPALVIESDQTLPVQTLVELMELAKSTGLTRLGLVTRQEAQP